MPVTRVGIVYSANQQIIRRIIHFDRVVDAVTGRWRMMTDDELAAVDEDAHIAIHQAAMHPDETWAEIPHVDYHAIPCHQDVHAYLGLSGVANVTDRHAVVADNGMIVDIVCADHQIDHHPAGQLIPHVTAEVGGTLIDGVYTPPDSPADAAP